MLARGFLKPRRCSAYASRYPQPVRPILGDIDHLDSPVSRVSTFRHGLTTIYQRLRSLISPWLKRRI
jgi:hypothetical protein